MSDKQTYTTEHIKRYLEGRMSPAEMHALERAALEDPFLADALEGMRAYGNNDKFSADVDELDARLARRLAEKRRVVPYISRMWMNVAAVLFVVTGGIVLIVYSGKKNEVGQSQLAIKQTKVQPAPKVDTQPTRETVMNRAAFSDSAQLRSQAKKPAEASKRTDVPTRRDVTQRTDAPERASASAVQAERVFEQESKTEEPAALARVAPSDTPKVADQLQGKAAGVDIVQSNINDSVFDEVIVVGNGSSSRKQKKALSASQTRRRVIPGNGWDEFEQYIEDSVRIASADSIYSGEEQVSFMVGDDGQPESIKILRSISPSHDREAIRLLENGPAWKVKKGQKKHVTLKIIF